MHSSIFITATDTDAGKTCVAEGFLTLAKLKGLTTCGFKPIAAGCEVHLGELRNDDALILQGASTIAVDYSLINPVAFADPVAPHLAAQRLGVKIELPIIQRAYETLKTLAPDLLLVEGAGGWRLPLGDGRYMSDFVMDNRIPTILVVGMKLGCLNHALLTLEAMKRDGVPILGWVANHVDPDMAYMQENVDSLTKLIAEPCLGVVPHLEEQQHAADYLTLPI